jgi:hypothetical protein
MLLALAILALPLLASAAPPSTTRLHASGFGVAGAVSTDTAFGFVFGVNLLHGERPDLPWQQAVVFFGYRYDAEYDAYIPYLGAGEATVQGHGLGGQRVVGSLEANAFWDGTGLSPKPVPPIEVVIDAQWTGTGSVVHNVMHYAYGMAGSSYVYYDAQRWRDATVSGTVLIDGAPALVEGAQVLAETAGEFNLVAQP